MNPEELLAFVHHADETAESEGWVFGFEQGMEFAQSVNSILSFHVHFHQQAVDEDIPATDAAQEDQVNAVVEEGDEVSTGGGCFGRG